MKKLKPLLYKKVILCNQKKINYQTIVLHIIKNHNKLINSNNNLIPINKIIINQLINTPALINQQIIQINFNIIK